MRRMLRAVLAVAMLLSFAVGALALDARPAAAATLARVTDFGPNPTGLDMYLYVPDTVAPNPALLVLVHYCGGSAGGIFNGNGRDFATGADRHGYIVVVPEATRDGHCFDVSTQSALTRGGGGDSTGIKAMVDWTRQRHPVDPARVVVSGFSSGAMMANVLAAQYPDVFSAVSAYSGVPAGCFATTNGSLWNGWCSGGNDIRTASEWGRVARAMYPGYTGPYPRTQVWHGSEDTTLRYPNFGEEIKQWTNLHGLSQTPSSTDTPAPNWTRTRYGQTGTHATVEGISISGTGHTLPQSGMLAYAIAFLGLDGGNGGGTAGPVRSVAAGRCLDVPGASTASGAQTQVWDCHGGANQKWTRTAAKQLTVYGGKCLDAEGLGTAPGTRAIIWDCHGGTNQQWNTNADGTITNVHSGLCLDVSGTANGTKVVLRTCHGGSNQRWAIG